MPEFYKELVRTQHVLNLKHLGWTALRGAATLALGHLLRGQTNFVKLLWKFNSVYNSELQLADHKRPVRYEIALPPAPQDQVDPKLLYIHQDTGGQARALDDTGESLSTRPELAAPDDLLSATSALDQPPNLAHFCRRRFLTVAALKMMHLATCLGDHPRATAASHRLLLDG